MEFLDGTTDPIIALSVSTYGILASSTRNCIILWDLATETVTSSFSCRKPCALQFDAMNPNVLYFSSRRHLKFVDTRKSNEPFDLHSCLEEINSIDISPDSMHLVTSDDSGSVSLIDIRHPMKPVVKNYADKHDNIASVARFKPGRPNEIWSGGYDCTLKRWDFGNGLTRSISVTESRNESQSTQTMNPPFLLDMVCLEDVNYCGLGSGEIMVLKDIRKKGKKVEYKSDIFEGHDWSVSRICKVGESVVSGGLDGNVIFWDVTDNQFKELSRTQLDVKVNALCSYVNSNGESIVFVGGNLKKDVKGKEGKIQILKR